MKSYPQKAVDSANYPHSNCTGLWNMVSSNCTGLESYPRSNCTASLAVTVPDYGFQPNSGKGFRDAPVLTTLYLNIPILDNPPVSASPAKGITHVY